LGPFHRLSWGTLYPLIRRLEQARPDYLRDERRRIDALLEERGQPRKQYVLTESGRARFLTLMLDRGGLQPGLSRSVAIKLTKLCVVDPAATAGCLAAVPCLPAGFADHYDRGRSRVANNPGISDQERPFILQLADYHIHTLEAQLAWLDRSIADLAEAPQ